jgi:hypothetical protein
MRRTHPTSVSSRLVYGGRNWFLPSKIKVKSVGKMGMVRKQDAISRF